MGSTWAEGKIWSFSLSCEKTEVLTKMSQVSPSYFQTVPDDQPMNNEHSTSNSYISPFASLRIYTRCFPSSAPTESKEIVSWSCLVDEKLSEGPGHIFMKSNQDQNPWWIIRLWSWRQTTFVDVDVTPNLCTQKKHVKTLSTRNSLSIVKIADIVKFNKFNVSLWSG